MQNDGSLLEEKKKNYKFSKKERTKKEIRSIRNIVIIVLLIAGFIIFKQVGKPQSFSNISNASIGDEVTFGHARCHALGWLWGYDVPIEWVVLEKDDDKVMLLSEYGFYYSGGYDEVINSLNDLSRKHSFYSDNLDSDSRIIPVGDYYVTMLNRREAEEKIETIEQIKVCKPFLQQHEHLLSKGKPSAYWLYGMSGYVSKEGVVTNEVPSKERILCRPVIWVRISE